ncbi:MAG: sulfite exporter TauE/SafE family protein [Chitinophagaceae bacterium]|nr:sulfite exporter TauE/SafE family protein [Bacteroidota bacterium]TAJ69208.1 MAG: sulfite exporter TauE/SafE family protein [Chitinophagaceae bacterium]
MEEVILYGLFFLVAFLYASVGHGGASGYLALMALLGFSASVMKPTALLLNVMVSLIAFISFYRARHFRSQLLWPLIAASIPFAYLGSVLPVSEVLYKQILGVVLLLSIIRIVWESSEKPLSPAPKWYVLFGIGAGIGLVSGMIGMGGGILLSPLLLLMGWSTQKQTAAISAIFIFLNSMAGIAGQLQTGFNLGPQILAIIGFVLAGGWLGAYIGAEKLRAKNMKYILALVLVLAAAKLFFVK